MNKFVGHKVLWVVFLFFASEIIQGQDIDNTNKSNEQNIYYDALSKYLAYTKETRNIVPKTLLIDETETITEKLLAQNGETLLVVLDYNSKIEYFKKHTTGTVFKIFPLEYENGMFSVSFIPFGVRYKRKHFSYTNGGGYIVFYKFEDNRFVFVRIEEHGI